MPNISTDLADYFRVEILNNRVTSYINPEKNVLGLNAVFTVLLKSNSENKFQLIPIEYIPILTKDKLKLSLSVQLEPGTS